MPLLTVAPETRIYYEDFGSGIPIVFTHAGSCTHAMWEHQADTLAQEHRTITWDWRGVGSSDKPNGGYDIDTLVADLGLLLQHLDLKGAVLVGHGLGSHVAIMAAEKFASRVSGVGLVSTAPWCKGDRDGVKGGMSDEFIEWWFNTQMGSNGVSSAAAYAALCENWLFKNPPLPAEVHAMVACATQTPLYVMNAYRRSLSSVDHSERAKTMSVPTLIMQGRHDRKQRYAGAVHLQSIMRNARLLTFEESAHMPHVEEMQKFNGALGDFAREVNR